MKKKYVLIALSVLVVAAIVVCGQLFTVRHVSVVFYNKTGIADEADVISAAGLGGRNNIFNIKEADLKKNVAEAYPDNSIVVTDIVRNFPNKLTIYAKERIPIFKIKVYSASAEGNDRYVPTDKDFQRGTVQHEADISFQLITVTGFEVHETFDVKECVQLRNLVNTLIDEKIDEEALPYLISSINFEDGFLIVNFRGTGSVMKISSNAVAEQTRQLFNEYLSYDFDQRFNLMLVA